MRSVLYRLGVLLVLVCVLVLPAGPVDARSRGRSLGPGTGGNPRSHSVRPYIRRDGAIVPGHRRSNPNRRFEDNWTTDPNVNPYTRKKGTRINPSLPR